MNVQLLPALAIGSGMLLAGGLFAVVRGVRRTAPRLADAFAVLDGTPVHTPTAPTADLPLSERAGAWLQRHTPVPLLPSQQRQLELRQRSITEFYADKLVLALVGLVLPAFLAGMFALVLGWSPVVPVAGSLLGLVVGYFVPDLMLHREGEQAHHDAEEALFTYFDLVTLERLANQSATQSLQTAAHLSDNPLFVTIRAALLRAHLEQRAPYDELRRLADRLRLPALADVADVMQLDEQGAAVSGALRGRVRELRDAHLTAARIAAHEVSERMTVYMAVPALVLGLVFLVPPLIRLIG